MLESIKLRADPSILQVIAFNVIRRRGYKCNSGERRVWEEKEEEEERGREAGKEGGGGATGLLGSPLLLINFDSPDNMRRFCAWVAYFNQNLHKVVVLFHFLIL